ncbi:hypothetical protein OAE23_01470 [Synechococcus sp. AH-551-E11]|nr:hypothetical protein [Synechococcus sp. AH-551-E11]MDB4616752.1 hypothetical protein [Synechococcus sp. AH-551-E11]
MIEYTQADVDRMEANAKLRAKAELAAEAKEQSKTLSSEASKRAFNEWLDTRKTKQI